MKDKKTISFGSTTTRARGRKKGTLFWVLILSEVAVSALYFQFTDGSRAQRLCEHDDNAVAKISPCFGPAGTTITVTPGRRLTSGPARLVFKRVLANGVPSQVVTSISGSTATAPNQLCARGNGKWEVWLVLANGQSQGKIGAFTVSDCAGANSTGLGRRPPGSNNSAIEKIILPPITINVDNEVYVKTKSTSQSYIKDIASTEPEVATGTEWGTNEVKVRGKSPGVTTISFFDANTATLYRVQVTVEKKRDPPTGGGAAKTSKIDACLVGEWIADGFTDLSGKGSGGTGFVVTFKADGTETIDYSRMKLIVFPSNEKFDFKGTAALMISTENNVATIQSVVRQQVTGTLYWIDDPAPRPFDVFGAGPGALGGTANDNRYTCTEKTLEYKTSVSRTRRPTYAVKLRRVTG